MQDVTHTLYVANLKVVQDIKDKVFLKFIGLVLQYS